jgi:poly-gamma-glutamate capsule biosynthesis protein CapA/YwtB (metallophosphatase superfamily)
VDVVHGHSSHHIKGIEVYRGKLIPYGCGDLLNDYEGIRGFEDFRGDLSPMYFARLAPVTAELLGLRMFPTRLRDLRVNRATKDDVTWLKNTLDREGRPLGAGVTIAEDGSFFLRWDS